MRLRCNCVRNTIGILRTLLGKYDRICRCFVTKYCRVNTKQAGKNTMKDEETYSNQYIHKCDHNGSSMLKVILPVAKNNTFSSPAMKEVCLYATQINCFVKLCSVGFVNEFRKALNPKLVNNDGFFLFKFRELQNYVVMQVTVQVHINAPTKLAKVF